MPFRYGSLFITYEEIQDHIDEIPEFFGFKRQYFWSEYKVELQIIEREYALENAGKIFSEESSSSN